MSAGHSTRLGRRSRLVGATNGLLTAAVFVLVLLVVVL